MVSRWKDLKSFEDTFRKLSKKVEKDLRINELLDRLTLAEIVDDDSFETIDKQIIKELVERIVSYSIRLSELESIIKKRKSKFWASEYSSFYSALETGLKLIESVKSMEILRLKIILTVLNNIPQSGTLLISITGSLFSITGR